MIKKIIVVISLAIKIMRAEASLWLNATNHFATSITGEQVINRTLTTMINVVLSFAILLISTWNLEVTPINLPLSELINYVFLFISLAWFAMSSMMLKKGGIK